MTSGEQGLRTILVATDGSEFSTGAMRIASALATAAAARLVVLSVVLSDNGSKMAAAGATTDAEKAARDIAEAAAAEARSAGIATEAVIRHGQDPATAIVAAINELRADLIVLGRRGKRGLARRMLGDATAKVICQANCPVLVVPKDAVMWTHRILLATDGSPASDGAAAAAAALAATSLLPVSVLSVKVPRHSPERQAAVAGIIERTVQSLAAKGINAQGRTAVGAPTDEIIAAVADSGADLVVMGSEGRTAIGRLLVGSNSLAVIAGIACPVLVTAPEALRGHQTLRDLNFIANSPEPTYLVVADDTPEMPVAMEYACRPARANGGKVALLRVVVLDDFRMFGNVRDLMRAEALQDAQHLLDGLADKVEEFLGHRPQTFTRTGDPCTELLDLLNAEQDITALVLASGTSGEGPGALITQLATKHGKSMPVPLIIVPGHLS